MIFDDKCNSKRDRKLFHQEIEILLEREKKRKYKFLQFFVKPPFFFFLKYIYIYNIFYFKFLYIKV